MQATRKELLKKQINGKSIKDLMDQFSKNYDLKEAGVEIDSIDESEKLKKNEEKLRKELNELFEKDAKFVNYIHP